VTAQPLVADPGAIEQIAAAIQSGKTDPVALVEASLRRVAAVEKDVQGWCLLDRERALADAQTLRQEAQAGRIRSPLHGIPVAIKDVLDVAGLPTHAGSKTRAGIPPSTIDAHVVLRTAADIRPITAGLAR
jgi:aspartyl-tRNA(Asn)/glutamyl-tRNA(Gln) amidotransferase subunit A